MAIIAAGTKVPEIALTRGDEETFTQDDLQGETTILVFFPFAFSPVCTDQLKVYDEGWSRLQERGATKIYGVSTDPIWSQNAFRDQLGLTHVELLSDFEPKGETAKKLGAFFDPAGMTNRGLAIVGPDGEVRWSYLADAPTEMPPIEKLEEGLAAA